MSEAVLQIVCASLGTLGFALLFHVRPCHLPAATLGGALAWICYLIAEGLGAGLFLASLLAALAVCLWSETLARVRKAPANVFLIPGIIPLLPGSKLYYTMSAIVSRDSETLVLQGTGTALIAVGIVGGIVVASELVRIYLGVQEWRRQKKQRGTAA